MRPIDAEPIEKFIENGLNCKDPKKRFGHDAIEILTEIHYAPTISASDPPNPPLALEELREMDGEPVYFYFGPEHGEWALVLDRPEGVFLRLKNGIDTPSRFVHECGGQLYRRKPKAEDEMNGMKHIRFPPSVADEMVRAILAGRKTVTRRVVKLPDAATAETVDSVRIENGAACFSWSWSDEFAGFSVQAPYRPNDILYVRETFWAIPDGSYSYKADAPTEYADKLAWNPSIHMPREAARIFLRVTDVRVERLHGIDLPNLIAEGVTPKWRGGCACTAMTDTCMQETCPNRDAYEYECYLMPFIHLWDSTVKPANLARYGWEANPWVWVIEFERISKPEEGTA